MPESFAQGLNNEHGHVSLVELNTREIKLAEQIRHYIERRAKIDGDYADKLSKLHASVSVSSDESSSLVEKAWRTFVTEGENKAFTISQMAKTLGASSVGRIDKLIHYKKQLLHDYNIYHSRVEKDFHCTTDEVKRLNDTYRETARDLGKTKERMNNNTTKVKGEKDLKKLCDRIDRSSRKLNCNHNDYVLSIATANEHQRLYHGHVRPYLLTTMEDLMQTCVKEWKSVLKEICTYTSWCKEELVTSSAEINQSVDAVDSTIEYEGFLRQCNVHKGKPMLPYFFDATLLSKECERAGITENAVSLNDLTFQQLKNKCQALELQLEALNSSISSKQNEMSPNDDESPEIACESTEEDENQFHAALSLFDSLDKKIKHSSDSREVQELNCKKGVADIQLRMILPLLEELGDKPPPAYSKFDTSGSGVNLAELKGENGTSMMSRFSKPSATLPRLFSNILTKRQDRRSSISLVSGASAGQDMASLQQNTSTGTMQEELGEYVEPTEDDVLDDQTWFHGKVDRSDVAKLLKHDGDFLVREKSDGSGDCVLSVMAVTQMKHFILKKGANGQYKFEGTSFDAIPQLIYHHLKHKLPVSAASNVFIVNPIRRAFIQGDRYCFVHADVELGEVLGKGHFGDVYKGRVRKRNMTVAVKTCHQNADDMVKRKFLAEAEIMKPYDHPNVVALIGVCNDTQPYYILMEYAPHGDLLNYVKSNGDALEGRKLLELCVDVACGMKYLESKQTIHRDLAARNCLVGDDDCIKICDFGMSREENDEGIYVVHSTKEFPVKWTAPEVWQYKRYTTKSDVWSFGIVLWEIFSLGETPYPGWSNPKSRDSIEQGYRMPPPNGTPPAAYEIMQMCWKLDPDDRPVFADLHNRLVSVVKIFK